MTPDDWQAKYLQTSYELAALATDGIRIGDDVTEREGALLDELDALEMQAAAMSRAKSTNS